VNVTVVGVTATVTAVGSVVAVGLAAGAAIGFVQERRSEMGRLL
jgi:hypothetical protein